MRLLICASLFRPTRLRIRPLAAARHVSRSEPHCDIYGTKICRDTDIAFDLTTISYEERILQVIALSFSSRGKPLHILKRPADA